MKRRPCNFAEAIRQRELGIPFHVVLGDFLDAFYCAKSDSRHAFLEIEPPPSSSLEIPKDEYARLAAVAEKLAHDFELTVPAWVENKLYFLDEMIFLGKPASAYRPELIDIMQAEAPSEFLRRNILVSDNILTRR